MFKPHDLERFNQRFTDRGYVFVIYRDHPYCRKRGKILFHRLVVENKIGRYLTREESVHHVDGDRSNNDPDNLVLTTTGEHYKTYHRDSHKPRVCANCGDDFLPEWNDRENRPSPARYCSDACRSAAKKKNTSRSMRTARRIHNVDPEELRELVWKLPTSQIARRLGVSDNAVAKWCKKYGIDKPPRGYWAKKRAGKI